MTETTIDRDGFVRRNRDSLIRVALMAALALALASAAPPPLAMAVLSAILMIGASVAAGVALLRREVPLAPHFTRWDEAAALLGLSIAAGLMVDPVALEQAIQQHQQPAAAGPGGG